MRTSLILTIVCFALLSVASFVLACSGFTRTSIEDISRYELLVAATVVDVDDRGINAVLKVDRYFKGSGDEYLVVMRHPPALHYVSEIRNYKTGCLYDGIAGHQWQVGSYGYFPLTAGEDGTYRDDDNYDGISAHYIPQDAFVEYYSDNAGEHGEYVTLPQDEFEALLLQLSEQDQTTTPESNPYPLMRFLNVTTESGLRYRFNPDRSVTWLDPAEYPIAISNDGSHVMFRLDDDELGFQYLDLVKKPFKWSYGLLHAITGLFGQFSPDSSYVAVQERERMIIYLIIRSISEPEDPAYRSSMSMKKVASFDTVWPTTAQKAPLVWSANNRVLAYQDAYGIWVWDLFDKVEPRLVVPIDDSHVLLDLSSTGRFLRYACDGYWTLLDLRTGETWKDTLVSPDESRLIHLQANLAAEDSRHAGVVDRKKQCPAADSSCPVTISAIKPNFMFWFEPGFIGLVSSNQVTGYPWRYSLSSICCRGKINGYDLPTIAAFAFDASYNLPVFAFDGTMIGIDLWSASLFEAIDLSEHLDSPIVDLEWGQPIFYERQSPRYQSHVLVNSPPRITRG